AERRALASQELEIAGAARTEPEVVANQQSPRLQTLGQHLPHERFRRHAGEGLVEVSDADLVDAEAGQRLELVAQVGDAYRDSGGVRLAGRGGLLGEELARMRLEGEHAARQPVPPRIRDQRAHQRLVATMDAVEVADRDRARTTRS